MFESDDGRSVACTRQNSGKSVSVCPGPPPRPGATNDPAGTVCAIVIVVLGNVSEERLSHVAASELPLRASHASPDAIAKCLDMRRNIQGSGFHVKISRNFLEGVS